MTELLGVMELMLPAVVNEVTKGFDGLSSTNAAVNDTDGARTVSLTGVSSMQIQCRSSNTTGTETLTGALVLMI